MQKFRLKNLSKNAQHLVEFAFVVPILMLIIFVIIEVGMAINARMTVSEAVKSALVEVNNLSNLGGTISGTGITAKTTLVESYIGSKVTAYLIQHNIPNSGSIDVHVRTGNNYAVVRVTYDYNPIFVLPGMGKIIPNTYKFSSSQTLNPHIFQSNVFPNNRTTEQLSLYNQSSFNNFYDRGELVSSQARPYTAFLLHVAYYDPPPLPGSPILPDAANVTYARLISWEGYDLLPPNLRINLRTGTLEVRSPYYDPIAASSTKAEWVKTQIPYVWVVSALGINHLLYVQYNTDRILISNEGSVYYKLLLDSTNLFYNLGVPACGQISAAACNGNLLLTSPDTLNSINNKAIRMNPRLGTASPWIDTTIAGTMEPVKIIPPSGMPSHPFQLVNSPYFSYTPDYDSWSSAGWSSQYLLTISTPHIEGLLGIMPDDIYNANISSSASNSFFSPYIPAAYKNRIMLCESIGTGCTPGTILYPTGATLTSMANGNLDGNIDANSTSGWDDVETTPDNYYVVDIFDIIFDSDGDGIPDAWDRDPSYFDANENGILDGNEINPQNFKNNNSRCNDSAGIPYNYQGDPAKCASFPESITVDATNITRFTYLNASPALSLPFYKQTPYMISGALNSVQTTMTSLISIPTIDKTEMYTYTLSPTQSALYYKTSTGTINLGQTLVRKYPTWHDPTTLVCSNLTPGVFTIGSGSCAEKRSTAKNNSNFASVVKASDGFVLDSSNEFASLNANNFDSALKIPQTPPTDW